MSRGTATTKYFLYVKSAAEPIASDGSSQIFFPNSGAVHLLPAVNLPYYSSHGLFEKGLIEWCAQFGSATGTFLDVGAHSGTYAISLASHFKAVHAFEPQRATYYSLCGGVALSGLADRVTCHNFGLGELGQIGTQSLNIVSPDGGGSSLHVVDGRPVLRREVIEVRTLDSMDTIIQGPIAFIKMDVEDNELSVLKGGQETLKRSGYPPILFESNHENVALFEFLKVLGYGVVPIRGISNMFLATKAA